MTEKEVVDFLRNNRTKGVAFLFLPEDVRDWIHEHFDDPNLFYLDSMGKWQYFKDTDFDDYDNVVFALPDTFYPQKPKGGWVEIDIEDDGKFRIDDEEERSAPARETYNWFDWQDFLKDSRFYRRDFTAFGGWQYPNNSCWSMYPQVKIGRGSTNYTSYYSEKEQGEDYEIGPATPCKIRFWKEKE